MKTITTGWLAIVIYFSLGITVITASHSFYCSRYHNGFKIFGIPFFEPSEKVSYKFGYLISIVVFFISMSFITNILFITTILDSNGIHVIELIVILSPLFLIFFIIIQIVGGASITKGILQFTLFFLTLILLEMNISGQISDFSIVVGPGVIFGLISIYVAWIGVYVFGDEIKKTVKNLSGYSNVEESQDDVHILLSTIVYFPGSSAYIIFGYWIAAYLIIT